MSSVMTMFVNGLHYNFVRLLCHLVQKVIILFGMRWLVTSNDDLYLTAYFGFTFTVAACLVNSRIVTTVLKFHLETEPTLSVCFQYCYTECFSEHTVFARI
jgi:ABC-type iron transport system FetAB permease component